MMKWITIIEAKPHIGYILAAQGGGAGLLTWLGIITPLVGFLAAVIGLAAGIITLMIKLKEWKNLK